MANKILKLDVLVLAGTVYTLHGCSKFQTLTVPQAADLMERAQLTRIIATRDATALIKMAVERRTPTRRLAIGSPQVVKLLGGLPPSVTSLQDIMDIVDGLRVSQGGWHLFDVSVDAPHMNVLSCETAASMHPAAAIREFFVTHEICNRDSFNLFLDLVRDPRWFVTHDDYVKFTRLHAYLDLRPTRVEECRRQASQAANSRLHHLLQMFNVPGLQESSNSWFASIADKDQHPRLVNKRLKQFVSFVATAWLGGITNHPELIVPDHFFTGIPGEKQLLADWKSTTAGCLRRY